MSHRILLIEDNEDLSRALRKQIESEGITIETSGDGKTGLDRALAGSFDLVIVDVNLPELNGLEVCRKLRQERTAQAIMMLTSRVDEIDKIVGFELGADDYVTKPFSNRELLVRIKALLRRTSLSRTAIDHETNKTERLVFGELEIDCWRRKVVLSGTDVDLTATEFDLLHTLAANPGRPFERHELVELVWGYRATGFDPTVTTHLSRLRAKLERDPNHPRFIKTVRGVGYRFVEPNEL